MWNTKGILTLKVPGYKVDKSIALIDYALDHRDRLSHLCTMAAVKGVLESEVDATSSRSRHTHLQSLERTLHPVGWEGLPYYSFAKLTDEDATNLTWWKNVLKSNGGHTSRADNASILVYPPLETDLERARAARSSTVSMTPLRCGKLFGPLQPVSIHPTGKRLKLSD
jgi:hypothetical protein